MSHVAMEKHICPVCGKEHSHNTGILLQKQLKDIGEVKPSGFSLCEEHSQLVEKGYVNMVVVDEKKSEVSSDGTLRPEGAYLTGNTVAVRREVLEQILQQDFVGVPFAYIDQEFFDTIVEIEQRNAQMQEETNGSH